MSFTVEKQCCCCGILDGEQHMLAAAHHLVKAVEANNRCTSDVRKLLADLNTHLSEKLGPRESEEEALAEIEASLFSAWRTIMNLQSNHVKIWDNSPATVEYIRAVEQVQQHVKSLESMPLRRGSRSKGLFDQARSVLERAMERLEEELLYILMQNKQCFGMEDESIVSNDESIENVSHLESCSSEAEECSMDLIHPDLIPQIKSIADTMFTSGYGHEFCQTFNSFWRDTLAEYLAILDVQQLSIADVIGMEWHYLNSRIRNWRHAINRIVVVYLTRVKKLFHQLLVDCGNASSACLLEASKSCLSCMLNFGQAVAIGPHEPERLFVLLDMFEALDHVIPELNALFPGEIGSLLRFEFRELLIKLGNSAVVIFKKFGSHIAMSSSSTVPSMNGSIHPLTKYVVNYILHADSYVETLRSLLKDEDRDGEGEGSSFCAVGIHLQSMTTELEANLDKKSKLYEGSSLKHIFILNNIHYMVDKIRKSKITAYFGDDWIKCHMARFRREAIWYQRLTWNPIVELVREHRDSGKGGFKARCQAFAVAFEEVYKIQTRWKVTDAELREELRISVINLVIPVYRHFVSEVNRHIGEKHIKYSEVELRTYILDLLQGSPKSLNSR